MPRSILTVVACLAVVLTATACTGGQAPSSAGSARPSNPRTVSPQPTKFPDCQSIAARVADTYLLDWSIRDDETTEEADSSSCAIDGQLRMKSHIEGHLLISIIHYAIFEDPDDNTDQAQDIAVDHIDFLCGKYGPGKRQDLDGPYDFAASCSRLAKRPAMVHTALSKGARVVTVTALADQAANDPALQRFLTTMSTGAATAAFRLIP